MLCADWLPSFLVGITGPRQSGKSTLAKAVFSDKKYVTFDDRTMRNLAQSNPHDFIMAFPNGAVIDEAQKVPEIFDAIKLHVDQEHSAPGKFILTGSSQFRLKENMTDSLAGRAAFLKLLPFSIHELKIAEILPKNPYELIFSGQYPPYTHNTDYSVLRKYLRQSQKWERLLKKKKGEVRASHTSRLLSMQNV